MEQVIWKAVNGYEGLYEVSNNGQVRSLDIYTPCFNGAMQLRKGRIKPIYENNRGYQLVSLCHKGKTERFLLHRIVANAFIPNPENKTQVNHIDGNIKNNNAANLEWVSDNENKMHSSVVIGGTQRPKRPVLVKQINSGRELLFGGLREAERALSLEHKSALNVVQGKQRQTKGYVLCYVDGGN